MSRRAIGAGLVIVSSLAFGTLALFARKSYEAGISPVTLLMIRFGLAAVVLLALAAARRTTVPPPHKLRGLFLLGALYVGQSFCFFTALNYAPTSMVSLMLYMYPIFVTFVAVSFLGERMFMAKWGALGLAVSGTVLTIVPSLLGSSSGVQPLGIVFGVGTAVFYSAYILLGTRVMPGVDATIGSFFVIGTAAVAYLVWAVIQGPHFPATPAGWIWPVLLALVSTVIAIGTLLAGLERIGPVDTSTIAAVEPITTATLAIAFLGERLSMFQVVGGILILGGVVLLTRVREPADR